MPRATFWAYLTIFIGKSGRNGISAVGFLFSDRLLGSSVCPSSHLWHSVKKQLPYPRTEKNVALSYIWEYIPTHTKLKAESCVWIMDTIRRSIYNSLLKLFQPLVQILLKHGISYAEASELLKRAYVVVAETDFALENKKQTTARISVLTGMHRKEVTRLRELDFNDITMESLNRAARVISGWLSDSEFRTRGGTAAILPQQGKTASFSALSKRYSGDMPSRAVLDELLRCGAVSLDTSGAVCLKRKAYIPTDSDEQLLQVLGICTRDLLNTIAYNIAAEQGDTRLQLSVAYNNLSAQSVAEFKALSRNDCLELIEKYNQWLAKRDRDSNSNSDDDSSERWRSGLGIYVFEEMLEKGER